MAGGKAIHLIGTSCSVTWQLETVYNCTLLSFNDVVLSAIIRSLIAHFNLPWYNDVLMNRRLLHVMWIREFTCYSHQGCWQQFTNGQLMIVLIFSDEAWKPVKVCDMASWDVFVCFCCLVPVNLELLRSFPSSVYPFPMPVLTSLRGR